MEKFEFKINIYAENSEAANKKAKSLVALSKMISTDELINLRETIEENPRIIPFIKEITSQYNMRDVKLLDVLAIAKKAYTEFKD